MVIERNIIKKVGEYNNIAICDERTVRIELTEAEIEEAYRIREREYLEEDIKNAVEEFCDYWGIPKGIAGGLMIIRILSVRSQVCMKRTRTQM